jgi:hypothetical protein
MTEGVYRFFTSFEEGTFETQADLIDFFVYYITCDSRDSVAVPRQVKKCFEECDLKAPAGIPARLSEGTNRNNPKYVKKNGGYRLQRNHFERVAKMVGGQTVQITPHVELRKLEKSYLSAPNRSFLTETIDCFEVGAYRAAIVMCWILVMDHFYEYVFKHKLSEFNLALAANKDKRIKINKVTKQEDFSELPESKFIEFCRSSKIISNDVRKILEEKLGTRNSAAHPSAVEIKPSKAIDFVEDLISNGER